MTKIDLSDRIREGAHGLTDGQLEPRGTVLSINLKYTSYPSLHHPPETMNKENEISLSEMAKTYPLVDRSFSTLGSTGSDEGRM